MNKVIHHPNDKLFKETFKRKAVMQDFLKARLAPDLLSRIQLASLKLMNASFISRELKELRSDLIYSAQISGALGYIHFLIEHQSEPAKDMALRLLEYNVQLMREALKQGASKLPIIINFVLYTGKEPYPHERSLTAAFASRQDVHGMLDHCFLIELRAEDKDTIQKDGKAALAEFVLRESHVKDFCKELEGKGHIMELLNRSSYAMQVMLWILDHDPHKPKVVLENLRKLSPDIKHKVMTQLQRIEQRGRQEGMRLILDKLTRKGLLTKQQAEKAAKED